MALVFADRVKDTTTTTGTGTVTLSGTAPAGFQNFSVIGNGNTTYYTIAGGSEWEVGIGTYTSSGTTLSRDTVLSSSAGGTTKVTFSAGTKDVFVTYPAERSVNLSSSALTSGRVPYATTDGLLTDAAGFSFSGTALTFPSPFTLGSTSVTSTGTQLNYLNAATGTTGTTSTNLVFSASPTFTGTLSSANQTLTTTSANSLAVGRQGTTNPVLNVDASTASVVTGLNLKGAAAAGGMALSVTSSGTNENLTIDAKGSGTITLNGTATGGITLTRAVTMSSTATATSFIPTATGTTGLGLAASNTPAIYANSTEALRATSTQVTSQLKLSSPKFFTNSGTQTGVVVNTWYNTNLSIGSQSPACFMFWASQPSGAAWLFYQFITENGNGSAKTVTTTPTSNMEVQFSGTTLQVRSTSSALDITYGWVEFMQ